MTTLMTTAARPGDKAIVTGAGPVGICAIHVFRIAAAQPECSAIPGNRSRLHVSDQAREALACVPDVEACRAGADFGKMIRWS